MAWTTPSTRSTGYVVLASDWNTDLVNNLIYLHGDAGAIDVSAGGNSFTAATMIARASAGNNAYRNFLAGGDTQPSLAILGSGTIQIGVGGSTAVDTSFGRVSAGVVGGTATESRFVRGRTARVTPTYGTTVTPDASAGEYQIITVTNATAFTIANPTNPPSGTETQRLTIDVFNNSGGAMGAITWGSLYLPLSAGQPVNWSNPATTKHRAATFYWDGSRWINMGTTSVDA